MKNRKIKLSILTRIAILFLDALIVSVVIIMLLSHSYMVMNAAIQAGDFARAVAMGAGASLGTDGDFSLLFKDAELRRKTHDAFRFICEKTGIRYLYLYTVDEEGVKHYIVCAAKDDEEDRRMNEEYGFGSKSSRPLFDGEKAVLSGKASETFEYISNDYGEVYQYVVPAYNTEDINALIGVDYPADGISVIARKNVMQLILQGAVVVGLAYVLSLLFIRILVIKPIKILSGKMKNFIDDRKAGMPSENANHLFEDEMTDIEGSFNKMARDISDYVQDIEKLSEEKTEVRTQFDIAHKIQSGIIPRESFFKGNGYGMFGIEKPAREVGGDFYNVFYLDKENICVVAGDISGKGIAAALVMFMIMTAIKEKLSAGISLADTLNRLNQEMYLKNPENMFATVFVMKMNVRTGAVSFANAGHNPPILLSGSPSLLEMNAGTPLGLFEDSRIIEEKLQVGVGEGILIYTDGITESINSERQQYGGERLCSAVMDSYKRNGCSYDERALVYDIEDSVGSFSGSGDQFDDMTCCALVRNEYKEKPDMETYEVFKNTILTSFGNNEKTRRWILACEEIYVNIISYSGADNVSIRFERREATCSVTFFDDGMAFDPNKADVGKKEFEELDSGGMGIMLAGKCAKEMIYNRIEGINVMTLRFEC